MRRTLVLTTESARHPLRRQLPQPSALLLTERGNTLLVALLKTWFSCFAATIIFLS